MIENDCYENENSTENNGAIVSVECLFLENVNEWLVD